MEKHVYIKHVYIKLARDVFCDHPSLASQAKNLLLLISALPLCKPIQTHTHSHTRAT